MKANQPLVDGIETMDHDNWVYQPGPPLLNRQEKILFVSIGLACALVALACWSHFWINQHDKDLKSQPANQEHHARVVNLPPQ